MSAYSRRYKPIRHNETGDRPFRYETDIEFTNYLIKEIGVAVVPGSSFFCKPEDGQRFIRFCFSKTTEILERARERLLKLQPTLRTRDSIHSRT